MPILFFCDRVKVLTRRWRAGALAVILGCSVAWTHAKEVTFVTLEYPPFASESMAGGGGVIRLLRGALEGSDWQPKVVFLPWARARIEVAAGHADGVLPLWPQEVIDFGVTPTQAVFESKLGFYVRRSEYPQREVAIDRMQGQSVCTVRAYGYPPIFVDSGVKRDEAGDDEASLKKLAARRCDYAVMERSVGEYLLSRKKPWRLDAPVQWKGPAFASLPLFIGVVPGRPDSARLLSDIEAGISRMKKDRRFKVLVDEFFLDVPDGADKPR